MATVNFSVPEKIKKKFNLIFSKENKSQVVARLMEQAIEERERQSRRSRAIDHLLDLRQRTKPVTEQKMQKARQWGRP